MGVLRRFPHQGFLSSAGNMNGITDWLVDFYVVIYFSRPYISFVSMPFMESNVEDKTRRTTTSFSCFDLYRLLVLVVFFAIEA